MRTYDQYKDSGIEWIGEIPEHWEVKKLKYIISIRSGDAIETIEVDDEYDIPVFGGNGVMGYTYKSNSSSKELIIGRVGAYCGNVYLSDKEKWISDNALRVKTHQVWEFVFYYLKAYDLNRLASQNAQPLITGTLIKEQFVSVPHLKEQTAIANYLDTKTAEIDQTIANKEALINLFEEEKKALINEAVTKGLNPKVKLKPSGIDWLGDIPEHWEVKKLKYVADINPTKSDSDLCLYEDKEVIFLPMEKVTEDGSYNVEIKKPFRDLQNGFTYFKENDVIVAKITPCFENGKGAYLNYLDTNIGFGSTEFHVVRAKEAMILPAFIFYNTRSFRFMNTGEASMTGAAGQKRIPTIFLQNFPLVLPPFGEQTAIVQYIETETTNINEKINLIKQEIELLKEYRQALIFEAVTGKIKVSD